MSGYLRQSRIRWFHCGEHGLLFEIESHQEYDTRCNNLFSQLRLPRSNRSQILCSWNKLCLTAQPNRIGRIKVAGRKEYEASDEQREISDMRDILIIISRSG